MHPLFVSAARLGLAGLFTVGAAACSAGDSGGSGSTAGSRRGGDSVSEPVIGAAGAPAPGSPSGGKVTVVTGSSSGGAPGAPVGAADSCEAISAKADNRRAPADIIIAVDNSGSMDEEIAFVRAELNRFSQQIEASGVDVRIILISAAYTPPGADVPSDSDDGDDESDEGSEDDENGICIDAPLGSGSCPDDSNAPRYTHVPTEVGSHDALNLIIDEYPRYQSQLRPEATKTFVVVTDDNAEDEPNDTPAGFRMSVAGLPGGLFPQWTFSGIFCQRECPEAAEVGTVYQQLVSETMGIAGDLCDQNFAPVFDALATAVIASTGLACQWSIPSAPAGQSFDRSKVNVQYALAGNAPMSLLQVPSAADCAARAGWYYDNPADPKQILVCPAACDMLQNDVQASFEVLFGCETQLAPQ
jgi:hypothetical protein